MNIRRIHTSYKRPNVYTNRSLVLPPHQTGIIHLLHPKTPKTDEILDEVHNEQTQEIWGRGETDTSLENSSILAEKLEASPQTPATLTTTIPTAPHNQESHLPGTPAAVTPSSSEGEKPYVPWKAKYGYTLNLKDLSSAEDMSRKTRNGVVMGSDRPATPGARRIVIPQVVEDFRRTMRTLPGPIVVLTAANYVEGAPNVYRGITISSFSSLSLSPDPLVTFNIKSELRPDVKPSRALRILRKAPHFLIHIINDTPEGVRLANFFATVHDNQFTPEAQEKAGFEVEELADFRHTAGTPLILPRLKGKGISRVIRCEIMRGGVCVPGYDILGPNVVDGEAEPRNKLYTSSNNRSLRRGFIRIGDHVLCIARVHEVMDNIPPVPDNEISGLGYMDGRYRSAGRVIEFPDRTDSSEDKS